VGGGQSSNTRRQMVDGGDQKEFLENASSGSEKAIKVLK
jgi:hypothetical protein